MKIVIIANYVDEPIDISNSRFKEIASGLAKKGNEVEVLTSSFGHMKKAQKGIDDLTFDGYKVVHLYESGYPKNICLKRFISHYKFAMSVKNYLYANKKPDVIYLAVPSLSVGTMAADYCKKENVKLVIDVQDLWPEAFKMVFNPPIIGKFIYLPFELQANKIYRNADSIVAVSETYVNRALSVNKKCNAGLSVYLGTDLAAFDEARNDSKLLKDDSKFVIAYCGTLGHSYNICGICDAIKLLNKKGINNIEFKVMGDGPLRGDFEDYAKKLDININFTGYLPYKTMVQELCVADIAVNCITDGTAASIINKVGDYAAAAQPVINTQLCKEYWEQVERLNIGINCHNDNTQEIATAIEKLITDVDLRKTMGSNNRKFAEEKFDREVTYKQIISAIEATKLI